MLRNLWAVLAIFALVAMSSAFSLDDLSIDGIEEYLHHGEKRQASGTGGNTPTPAPSTTPRPPTSAPPSPTPQPSPSNDPVTDPTTSNPPPAPSSPAPSTPNQPTSPRTTPGSSPTNNPPASSVRTAPITRTSHLVSTSLQEFITVITTISDGQEVIQTSTGTSSIPITTGEQVTTETPSSQEGSGDGGSGLSQNNKNIIGGVVGGVGGALLLGGIALVFWRMKKRQHRVTEDDDDLMAGTGSALGDKPQNGTGASPFQSNLEQYHNPGGRPNAAANF